MVIGDDDATVFLSVVAGFQVNKIKGQVWPQLRNACTALTVVNFNPDFLLELRFVCN